MMLYILSHIKIRNFKLSSKVLGVYHTKQQAINEMKIFKEKINKDWEEDGEIPKQFMKENKPSSYRLSEPLFLDEDYLKIEKYDML